jgi:hypothetical protein
LGDIQQPFLRGFQGLQLGRLPGFLRVHPTSGAALGAPRGFVLRAFAPSVKPTRPSPSTYLAPQDTRHSTAPAGHDSHAEQVAAAPTGLRVPRVASHGVALFRDNPADLAIPRIGHIDFGGEHFRKNLPVVLRRLGFPCPRDVKMGAKSVFKMGIRRLGFPCPRDVKMGAKSVF